MTSEPSKTRNHVHHLRAASEGLRKDGGRFSAHEKGRKVEKKKKEATSASSDPGERQQSQGEGQEKEGEGVSVFSDPGEETQQNHGESPETEKRGVTASLNQEEEDQKDQEESQEWGKQEGASTPSEEEQRRDQDKSHERSPSPLVLNTLSEGLDKERLARLRNQLQAQFSIQEHQEDQSPCGHLVELVGRIVHREGDDRARPANRDTATEGQCPTRGQCSNMAGCSRGPLTEMEKALQRELAVLKEEVTASIESMRKELAEEMSSLREALQAYNKHRFPQAADLSPLEELDENGPTRLEEGRHAITQVGKLPDKISAEEKFKSRSVPALQPLPVSGRNQAVLRAAMNTITARSGFASHLSRSNSDPVEPAQAQSTIFPPAIPRLASKKTPVKMLPPPATRTYASKGYSNKMPARTPDPHPPCDICEGRSH